MFLQFIHSGTVPVWNMQLKGQKVEFWSSRHVPPTGGGALAATAESNLATSSVLLDLKPYYSLYNVMRKFMRL